MLASKQVVRAEPPIDRPAAADAATVRGFRAVRRWLGLAVAVLVVLSTGLPLLAVAAGTTAGGIALGVLGVAALGGGLPWLLRHAHWLRGLERSAPRNRWRKVPAGLVRGGVWRPGCVLMVDDGSARKLLRLHGIPWPYQLGIAYAGAVWLLGPDVGGRQAAAVPGVRIPFRATAIAELPPGAQPVEPAPGSTGTALDEPVTAATAQFRTRVAQVAMLGVGALIGLGLIAAVTAPIAGLGWAVGWSVVLGLVVRAYRLVPGLTSGLTAGAWTPLVIRPAAWPEAARGPVTVDAEVRLPDGSPRTVDLLRADEHLVANARVGGRLWFAGYPQPGKLCAVGIPGVPVLGVARVR